MKRPTSWRNCRASGGRFSFLGTGGAAAAPAASTSSGRFGSVSDQLVASLEALGLPHHGVQFAAPAAAEEARSDLIEGLLDNFQKELRAGNVIFVPGGGADRRAKAPPSQVQSGAARVAARLVRAEADNILDILDRLPDMTRFHIRPGSPTGAEARGTVAERFDDLDEVMADPIGVNLPRAEFALRRIEKALLDFFDFANLEPELADQFRKKGDRNSVSGRLPRTVRDEDELGQRRSVVQSEELRREIAELVDSLLRLKARVRSPLGDTLGTTAARLEQTLTVVYGSARSLRDILVRSGSSLPEQDVQLFATGITVPVEDRWTNGDGGAKESGRQNFVILSSGQVLDWIMEVSEPYVGAANRSVMLESEDFAILAGELEAAVAVVERLMGECHRLGFAYRLPGPMRQLEELKFHIKAAAKLARAMTEGADRASASGVETHVG